MSGTPVGVDNTSRRKFDKEEYLERARQREQREKDEARKGKERGPPVQRQPLKHRDYEVDLDSHLGKTQDPHGNKVVKEVIFGQGEKKYRYCKVAILVCVTILCKSSYIGFGKK